MRASSRARPIVAVMARFPRAGAVKTRLAPLLGPEGAADLHRELAAHCVARLRPLHATGEATIEVHFEGGSQQAVREWIGGWPRLVRQPEGDLGDRLHAALSRALHAGAPSAVVVGSDCPGARPAHVRAALRALESKDVVVGPAEDGGYWLLGVSANAAPRALAVLFDGISWGGDRVFAQTMERAERSHLRVAVVDRLADVDRPEDVAAWNGERIVDHATLASVSVIVPAIDEAGRVAAAIDSALSGGADEVIVVDGGSTDGTQGIAAASGARVIQAPPGRASQMNAGASVAVGDALVFLHADTRLPAGFARMVLDALAEEGVTGGAFTWGTDDTRWSGLFNRVGRARVAIFRVPYGDQAIFVSKRTFDDLGGYPAQVVMEDWELARALGRLGKMRILPARALTSSRRWTETGVFKASVSYLAIMAGYRLGVDPAVLDGWRQP